MGIRQLSKLLKKNSACGVKERPLSYYSSKRIAIDASMCIYQFLIAVRTGGSTLGVEDMSTSHLVGIFNRTIKMIELGIVPVYVFDGVPPEIKEKELNRRAERRTIADERYKDAKEAGDEEKMEMYEKRRIKMTSEHVEDCKKLLYLMGVPFEVAPSEAEAYCALLCKRKKVYGVATEDMDALTFGSPVILRNFGASQLKRSFVVEYQLGKILEGLSLDMNEFIDLCILLGCDYCDTIRGVGPERALKLILKSRRIENILKDYAVKCPENWRYREAREIFLSLPETGNDKVFRISWDTIDKKELAKFLVEEKGFNAERVDKSIDRLIKSRKIKFQGKLDSIFMWG